MIKALKTRLITLGYRMKRDNKYHTFSRILNEGVYQRVVEIYDRQGILHTVDVINWEKDGYPDDDQIFNELIGMNLDQVIDEEI